MKTPECVSCGQPVLFDGTTALCGNCAGEARAEGFDETDQLLSKDDAYDPEKNQGE